MPKELPILFSTPMVEAITDSRKTMTRRIVKHPHILGMLEDGNATLEYIASLDFCPYGKPGDLLYVRETWQHTHSAINLSLDDENSGYIYKASGNGRDWESNTEEWKWKPRIHLPKEGSRIWLEVTGVRIERIQDIKEEDAVNEGVERLESKMFKNVYKNYSDTEEPICGSAKQSFRTLWESINGRETWDANVWVWVASFKVLSTTGKPDSIPNDERSVATVAESE